MYRISLSDTGRTTHASDRLFPEWNPEAQFISKHLNGALRLDSKPSSHPIEVDIPDANKVNQIFDQLSYGKAASREFQVLSVMYDRHVELTGTYQSLGCCPITSEKIIF